MPIYDVDREDPVTGRTEPYSVYSPDKIDQAATGSAIDNFLATGKQAWSNGKGTLVTPPQGACFSTQAAQAYSQYVGAPATNAINSMQQSNVQQTEQMQPGIRKTIAQTGNAAMALVGNYAKEIVNDPGMAALTVAGGAAGALGAQIVNPIAKLAPSILGRFAQIVTPPAVAGATYGAARQLFDPNASIAQNAEKAGVIGVAGLALNIILKGLPTKGIS